MARVYTRTIILENIQKNTVLPHEIFRHILRPSWSRYMESRRYQRVECLSISFQDPWTEQ